jgi:hypothetical protein
MSWYERKVMEKVTTFLSNDAAFQKLTCLNLVTCQNEFAGIFQSAVSEKREELDATRFLARARARTYTGSSMTTRNTV